MGDVPVVGNRNLCVVRVGTPDGRWLIWLRGGRLVEMALAPAFRPSAIEQRYVALLALSGCRRNSGVGAGIGYTAKHRRWRTIILPSY